MIFKSLKEDFNAAGFACAAALRPMLAGDADPYTVDRIWITLIIIKEVKP